MFSVRTALLSYTLTAAAFAISSVAFSTAAKADKTVWNANIFGPPRAVTKSIEAMADFYKEKTNGELEFNIAYGGALGPEKQIPEGVKSGAFEIGQMCVGYYPNKFPLLSVMELPFLPPRDTATNAKVQAAVMAHPAIIKEMADRWNVKYLAPTFLPPYEFMGNVRIRSVDDMKGVKMRISGLNAKALQVFGAVPTMVTAPEAYTALERGTIDTFGFPYAYTFGAYKLYEVSKYVTEGVAMGGFMCWEGVSLDAWNKLPKKYQDLLPEAQEVSTKALLQAYKDADAKWIPIFHEKLTVDAFPPDQRAKLAAGANDIWEQWVKDQEAEGRPGREMLNFVKEQVAKYETN